MSQRHRKRAHGSASTMQQARELAIKRGLGHLTKEQMLDIARHPIEPGSHLVYSEELNRMIWVPPVKK